MIHSCNLHSEAEELISQPLRWEEGEMPMNFVEQFANATVGEAVCTSDIAVPVTGRRRRPVGRLDPHDSNWELSLRLEEQRRERTRIARELHDTLFQGFFGASLLVHCAAEQVPPESPSKRSLSRALRMMQSALEEARVTLQGLRSSGPPASASLEEALSTLRDEFDSGHKVEFRIFVNGRPKALRPAIQAQIYLIGREALLNALHHSQATKIEVEVEYLPRRLRLLVRDNGCGIDSQVLRSGRESHWGLLGMRERAVGIGAKLRIWSGRGMGTELELSVSEEIARLQ
jgi:signal transduction histidine kinase